MHNTNPCSPLSVFNKKVFEKTECTEEAKERVEKKKEVPERARRGKRDFMELCISILTNLYIMETSIIP